MNRAFVPPARWRSLAIVLIAVLTLGAVAIALNWYAANEWRTHPDLLLMFPYLAATTVFFSTCVWVVCEGHVTVETALAPATGPWTLSKDPAVRALAISFVVITAVLAAGGMAGPAALKAIKSIDCYLTGNRNDDCILRVIGTRKELWAMPFNYGAAMGNAAALATLVYLGLKCRQLAKGAWNGAATPAVVIECMRAITTLLVLASALLVSSTLALFLLFSVAAEIDAAVLRPRVPLAAATTPVIATCASKSAPSAALECLVTVAPKSSSDGLALAPSMAFVAGLSFTGALFFLFMTTSSAIDDALARATLLARMRDPALKKKEWRENVGIPETSASDRVLQALALLAPAITAGIALLVSK